MKKLTEASSARRRKMVQSLAQIANRLCNAPGKQEEPGEGRRPAPGNMEKKRRRRIGILFLLLSIIGY